MFYTDRDWECGCQNINSIRRNNAGTGKRFNKGKWKVSRAAAYIEKYSAVINRVDPIKLNGRVTDVIGLIIVSIEPNVSLGEVCSIVNNAGKEVCKCEVVGFKEGKVLSIALGEVENIAPSCEIVSSGKSFGIGVGD